MKWYYLENGQQQGPVDEAAFTRLVQEGRITSETFLWCHGMPEWRRYGELVAQPAPVAVETVAAGSGSDAGSTGLRIHHEAAAATMERQAACSRCGAVVPAIQLKSFGSMALCPKCQVAQARLGWDSGQPGSFAHPLLRIVAFLVDVVIFVTVMVLVVKVGFDWNGAISRNSHPSLFRLLAAALFNLLWSLYYFVWRISGEGCTFGMKLFKISVVHESGGLISGWRAFGRHFIFGLVLQFTLGLGNVFAFFDKRRRCLHDMVCSTVVIKQ